VCANIYLGSCVDVISRLEQAAPQNQHAFCLHQMLNLFMNMKWSSTKNVHHKIYEQAVVMLNSHPGSTPRKRNAQFIYEYEREYQECSPQNLMNI
jgi:uncharacterized membrane protein YheB (UPF0754 family)